MHSVECDCWHILPVCISVCSMQSFEAQFCFVMKPNIERPKIGSRLSDTSYQSTEIINKCGYHFTENIRECFHEIVVATLRASGPKEV